MIAKRLGGPYHLHHNKQRKNRGEQRKNRGEAMGKWWKEQEGKEDAFSIPLTKRGPRLLDETPLREAKYHTSVIIELEFWGCNNFT